MAVKRNAAGPLRPDPQSAFSGTRAQASPSAGARFQKRPRKPGCPPPRACGSVPGARGRGGRACLTAGLRAGLRSDTGAREEEGQDAWSSSVRRRDFLPPRCERGRVCTSCRRSHAVPWTEQGFHHRAIFSGQGGGGALVLRVVGDPDPVSRQPRSGPGCAPCPGR